MKLSDNNNPNANSSSTPLSSKIDIFYDLFTMTSENPNYSNYFETNAMVLYMAFLLKLDFVTDITPKATKYIDMAWQELLSALDTTDSGFVSLDNLLQDRDMEMITNGN